MQSLTVFLSQISEGESIAIMMLFMAITAIIVSLVLRKSKIRYPLAFLLAHTITLIAFSIVMTSLPTLLSFILIDLPISGFFILYMVMRGQPSDIEAYAFFIIAGGLQYYTIGRLVAGYMAKRERKREKNN